MDDDTDSESYISYNSWDETDDESEGEDVSYESGETSMTKYNIVICEKYDEEIHGIPYDEEIHDIPFHECQAKSHFITIVRFKILDMNIVNAMLCFSSTDARLEIAEVIYLPSYHCVSIIKTFWLKLVQRKWKKIVRERKLCMSRRGNPNSLKYKEIHGKWPDNCSIYPRLKGMLSNLSRTSS